MLGIAVDHMVHGGQHRRGDGHTPSLSPGTAFAASELTFQEEEPGVLRFRRAAHKASLQHGLIADETHEFQFKGGFDEGRRTGELGQGIECVEDMGEHRLGGDVFLTDGLHHLGKVGPQRQLIHVLPHPPEEFQRFGGVEGIAVLVGKEGQFRVDQQLRPRRQRASPPLGGIFLADFLVTYRQDYPEMDSVELPTVNVAGFIAWIVGFVVNRIDIGIGMPVINCIIVAFVVKAILGKVMSSGLNTKA